MIIDAHNHPDWCGHDMARFVANMDEFGIDRTWLLTWECPTSEYDPSYCRTLCPDTVDGPISLARALRYTQSLPERFVLGYAPDPRRPDAIDRLRAAVELYGARICGEIKLRMMYDNPDALRLYRFCGEQGLPVTVHIDYEFDTGRSYPRPNYWYGGGIEALARALEACPDTIFIGHAPGLWAHISGDDKFDKEPYPKGEVVPGGRLPQILETHSNLWCDLSAGSAYNALERDWEHARGFILRFQDRLLYGRDFFDNRMQELLRTLDLPEPVLDKLFSGNATRLLGGGIVYPTCPGRPLPTGLPD